MSISVAQLEKLSGQLHHLADRLQADRRRPDTGLDDDDPLIIAANECDFLLPSPLTVGTLAETVQKKLDNVAVLLERARMHESLPEDAQVAAEEENRLMDEDYRDDAVQRRDAPAQPGASR